MTRSIPGQPGYYPELKKRLWIGTLVTDAVLLAVVAFYCPAYLKYLGWGVLMGFFYLWSLSFNAEHPKKGIQFVFSLIRIWIFAYVIVKLSNARVLELAIVMCGLLSYKVILTVEYVVQAMRAFSPQPLPKR
jgi:hypothetical protein